MRIHLALILVAGILRAQPSGLETADLYRLRSVGDVQLSPEGNRIAFTVSTNQRSGGPSSQIWIADITTGRHAPFSAGGESSSTPRWSPDGRWLAFFGRAQDQFGLVVARADGTEPRFLTAIEGTNHPLPTTGERFVWSPNGKQIVYVSATPGPEGASADGDPAVITRYLYKPTASEGLTRFNDNRRTHLFVVNVETKNVRQLTSGHYYEHSPDWSPKGDEILFVSNLEANADRVFNYDVFTVRIDDGVVRRLTSTKSAEYRPHWSPDGRMIAYQGTRRDLTSSETTMEDTHIWLMDADGGNRRDLAGMIDNRQGAPVWTPEGSAVCFTVQERGSNVLYRLAIGRGQPEMLVSGPGTVGAFSIGKNGALAYAFHGPNDLAELYFKVNGVGRKLTDLNRDVLGAKSIAPVETVAFSSFDGTPVEAFLTRPLKMSTSSRHPLVAIIHGGPHGQQGPALNHKAQVYAAQGWASLMVNYRGSTGYGQKFADAIFGDQDGGEAKDVLQAVDEALRRFPWLDRDRMGIEGGSYGGQLTNWIITQTDRFRAAIPSAGISNLVSFNYMAYYHDYLAVEFGGYPTEKPGLMDLLWERSPIRYAGKVKTPTLFIHGENDNDVPIAEAEQFYIALQDAGVETVLLRYPREGHGLRETRHVVDSIDRSIEWYQRHFRVAPTVSSRN